MKTSTPFYLPRPAWVVLAFTLWFALFAAGCGKKKPIAQAPPAPPPAAPVEAPKPPTPKPAIAEFAIEPTTIERGQSAVLRWNVTNATEVQIDNAVGTVQASGTRRVIPSESTTYRLTATGAGGDATATATVTVSAPPAPPPPATVPTQTNKGTLETRVASDLQDGFFDYDSNNIRDDARTALTADAEALKKIFADFPDAAINLEGHCDERGSAEYNLGLGDRRSTAARDFLVQMGIPADKLKTISYGKERPACTESNESCWQRNRRAHFSTGQ